MSFFANLPQVTKNLLILNVLCFLATLIFTSKGIDVTSLLGGHYINSPHFSPYQVITYMFMHSIHDFTHILFNMLILVMFGAHLERIWGAKRFFIFYFSCGVGAFLLYNSIGAWQLMELKNGLSALGYDIDTLDLKIARGYIQEIRYTNPIDGEMLQAYYNLSVSTMVGASGALFGIMAGFAMLFPNTELMLLFPPIPIKAKYLIGAYLLFEIYASLNSSGDSIAHLAHVGGALVGLGMVLYWKKTDRTNFW